MAARIIIGKEVLDIAAEITIEEAMISHGKHPDAFLFLINGRPVPMTLLLEDGISVEALRVASGG
jgi:sulfur carrier protein